MDVSNRKHYIIILLIFANVSQSMRVKDEYFIRNREMCVRVAKHPFFDIDIVVGKPWKIYYTWNLKLDVACFEMRFRNASKEIINRVWSEMGDYLEQQPSWEAATLSLYMGPSMHEMLLFADQGPAGSFIGVPNMVRSESPGLVPRRKGVSLLKFQVKLLNEGEYLLFVDCNAGLASLAARSQEPPHRSEIEALVEGLKLGDIFPACT